MVNRSTEVFSPMNDDQLGRLSLIEAIRANTDAVNRLARHGEMQDRKLDEITGALGRIHTRLTLLERDTLKGEVDRNREGIEDVDSRLKALEVESQQRRGALSAVEWSVKNWPGVVGFFVLIALVLISTGKVQL